MGTFKTAPQSAYKIIKGWCNMAFKDKEKAIRYNNEFNKATYDRINLTVPKGNKDKIKAHAEENGESVNGFINRAIDETMERDKKGTEGEQ